MEERFEEVITTRERLRQLNKPPSHRMTKIAIGHIDDVEMPRGLSPHLRLQSHQRTSHGV